MNRYKKIRLEKHLQNVYNFVTKLKKIKSRRARHVNENKKEHRA